MPNIKKHLVSFKESTPIYAFENLTEVLTNLSRGSWLGVIERKNDFLRIITTKGEGWIRSEDAVETNFFNLKITRDDQGIIQYAL